MNHVNVVLIVGSLDILKIKCFHYLCSVKIKYGVYFFQKKNSAVFAPALSTLHDANVILEDNRLCKNILSMATMARFGIQILGLAHGLS